MKPIIAILTDFGTSDPYVGIMKGVIAKIAPQTPTIDITHEIPPGDIRRGAFVLWQSSPYFPEGSIFLCVVDPGVGTVRRPMILQCGKFTFVGPDNGLFTYLLDDHSAAWELANPQLALNKPKMTFHGRDIFAPAAAHAACGIPGSEFGPEIPHLERLPYPILDSHTPGLLRGEVLHADQFGNILTSLGVFDKGSDDQFIFQPWLGDSSGRPVKFSHLETPDGRKIRPFATFADIPDGACGIIIGSTGLVEIVANRQSAANLLNLRPGEEITLQLGLKAK